MVTDAATGDQKQQIVDSLQDMNVRVHRTVVEPAALSNSYPITITVRDPWAEAPSRAGYATVEDDKCTIEISRVVFEADKVDYRKPVIWHELGHCAGLSHDPKEGEVMYRSSSELKNYTADALTRFYQEVLSSIGM